VDTQPSPSTLRLPFAGDVENNTGPGQPRGVSSGKVCFPLHFAGYFPGLPTSLDQRHRTSHDFCDHVVGEVRADWGSVWHRDRVNAQGLRGCFDWAEAYGTGVVTAKDFEIPKGDLIGLQAALEKDMELL
jgi:hypothetical protein